MTCKLPKTVRLRTGSTPNYWTKSEDLKIFCKGKVCEQQKLTLVMRNHQNDNLKCVDLRQVYGSWRGGEWRFFVCLGEPILKSWSSFRDSSYRDEIKCPFRMDLLVGICCCLVMTSSFSAGPSSLDFASVRPLFRYSGSFVFYNLVIVYIILLSCEHGHKRIDL